MVPGFVHLVTWASKPQPEYTDFRVEQVIAERGSDVLSPISHLSSGRREKPSAHVAVGEQPSVLLHRPQQEAPRDSTTRAHFK